MIGIGQLLCTRGNSTCDRDNLIINTEGHMTCGTCLESQTLNDTRCRIRVPLYTPHRWCGRRRHRRHRRCSSCLLLVLHRPVFDHDDYEPRLPCQKLSQNRVHNIELTLIESDRERQAMTNTIAFPPRDVWRTYRDKETRGR